MFPGVTLKKVIYDFNWGALILLSTYNVGDVIGKYLAAPNLRKFYNEKCIYIFILFRFGFYAIFFMIATEKEGFFAEDW